LRQSSWRKPQHTPSASDLQIRDPHGSTPPRVRQSNGLTAAKSRRSR
jgi:hypothetical protein